ncbi:Palmitoyltransferase AKR1 [Araneus ventricosus]|uniref:Palmitoyltransferase AKR1 n=1 Tax=Araneus ventricosus TaxID=182803 RepID=A0A4Y2DHP2_ARAVE|nr:Palmitoyltransferase AKR1 [Araneus ventricosus]
MTRTMLELPHLFPSPNFRAAGRFISACNSPHTPRSFGGMWNLVSNLEPSGPKAVALPLGHLCNCRFYGIHKSLLRLLLEPMHFFRKKKTLAAVKFLVEKYSNHILCEKDENGHTAAHWACLGGHFNIVQYMVDIGVSVNIPSSSHIGAYPIHWACVEGHVSIVDLLLRNGVPMDICDINGCTPLITACQHGNSHLVCYLLGRGANKTICDRNGDTALHWASYKGKGTVWFF